MRTRKWLTLLLVGGLALTACSGNDDPAGDGGDETATDEATDGDEGDGGDGDAAGGALDVSAILDSDLDNCEEPSGDALQIGYAADLSEVGGYADQPGSEAAQFMAELINCSGGVDGTPVEVTVEDIQGDPDVTQRAAQDLLDAGVHAILGPPFSDFGLPLLQVVGGQVPVVFVASTEVLLSDAENNAFLTAFDDPAQANAAAQFALDQDFETAVTFTSPDAPYFEQNPTMFGEAFEEGGGEVLQEFSFSLEDSDFSQQVNELANLDPQPDVLYTAMIMPQTGTLLGQLEGAGLEDVAVIGADSFDATGVVGAGDVADEVYYTTHGFPGEGSNMQAFLDAFQEARGEELETVSFGTLAADAVLIVANAYAEVGELDPTAIAEQVKQLEALEVVTTEEGVTYAGTGGTPEKPVFIHQIVGGELELAAEIAPSELE